jgi:hypothetical protein
MPPIVRPSGPAGPHPAAACAEDLPITPGKRRQQPGREVRHPARAGQPASVRDAEVPDEGDPVAVGSVMPDNCTPLFTWAISRPPTRKSSSWGPPGVNQRALAAGSAHAANTRPAGASYRTKVMDPEIHHLVRCAISRSITLPLALRTSPRLDCRSSLGRSPHAGRNCNRVGGIELAGSRLRRTRI